MDKKNIKNLGYYLSFNKIKKTWKESVGDIVDDKILTDNEELISYFSKPVFLETIEKAARKPKKYDVYNKTTGKKIGELDKDLCAYNTFDLYVGSFNSAKRMLIIIIILFVLLMLLTFSLVSLIKVSTVGKRPVLIEITESSGNIVTQEFNVFSDIEGESLIYPGKSGEYLFKITNLNKFDILVIVEFFEENELDIPMVYNLRDKDRYIIGDDYTYVPINHLNVGNIVLEEGESIYLTMNWLWQTVTDEHDTQIGITPDTEYVITINVYAYEKELK